MALPWEPEKIGARGGIWHHYPERDGQPMQGFAKYVQPNTRLTRAVFAFAEAVRPAWEDRKVQLDAARDGSATRYAQSGPRFHANADKLRRALARFP